MNLRPRPLLASLAVLAAAACLPSADAQACGGCFNIPNEMQTSVVTGHRMAFAVSTTHTVLWDQIKYAGSPSDFAWVLPVHGGAVIEASSDAWFEALDAGTAAQIIAPSIVCPSTGGSSGGCALACFGSASANADFSAGAGGGSAPPPVTITHEGTVGPYETVTLQANVPDALPAWLTAHGYAIDPSVSPIIDAYTAEGFDFIALRLLPGAGVQEMKPVRVTTPGMSAALPLRMVAAGTGPTVALTLFIIGEGRWEAQNFPNAEVNPANLTWDFTTQSSDYATQRLAVMAQGGGRTWNNAYAQLGPLLSPATNGAGPLIVNGFPAQTLADAYVAQAVVDGVTGIDSPIACENLMDSLGTSTDQVAACQPQTFSGSTGAGGGGGAGGAGPADGGGAGGGGAGGGGAGGGGTTLPPCGSLQPGQVGSWQFVCGPLDDLAVALDGLHPADVWVTRLEANLPRAALAADLQIQAASSQAQITNILNAGNSTGSPCTTPTAPLAGSTGSRSIWIRNQAALFLTMLAFASAAVARRRRRTLVLPARPTDGLPSGLLSRLSTRGTLRGHLREARARTLHPRAARR